MFLTITSQDKEKGIVNLCGLILREQVSNLVD
jgi:hypothetical protein